MRRANRVRASRRRGRSRDARDGRAARDGGVRRGLVRAPRRVRTPGDVKSILNFCSRRTMEAKRRAGYGHDDATATHRAREFAHTLTHTARMATASLGRPRRSVFSLSLLFLLVALTSSLPRATRADDEWDSDDASASASLDDDLAPSEDVPLHRFEIEVVTTGKASGKEKRVDKPAFFLRGDDASAAAARFVYLHALPLEHVAHFAEVFRSEWEGNVPDDRKPRVRASRSKPPGPAALLARGKAAAEEKDHESAYVDYVRAIVGEGVDAEDPARIALDGDEMDEAKELLRAHHALHSRALVAADKTREQRAVAHEREVDVLRARRARRDREREDLEDLVTMLGSELESSESSASPFDAATRDAVVRSIEAGDWDAVIAAVSAADAAAARAGHPVDALRKATLAYAHYATGASTGTFYTLVPIRPRSRGERRSLRTLPVVSLRPGSLAFNPRHTSTPFNSN